MTNLSFLVISTLSQSCTGVSAQDMDTQDKDVSPTNPLSNYNAYAIYADVI